MSSVRTDCKHLGQLRPSRFGHRVSRGLSLFEVILALVVFACGMAGLMHCLAVAERAGINAQFLNAAIVRAKTVHSFLEMEAQGTLTATDKPPRTSGTFDDDRRWSWRVEETPAETMVASRRTVTVFRQGTAGTSSFSLCRIVPARQSSSSPPGSPSRRLADLSPGTSPAARAVP